MGGLHGMGDGMGDRMRRFLRLQVQPSPQISVCPPTPHSHPLPGASLQSHDDQIRPLASSPSPLPGGRGGTTSSRPLITLVGVPGNRLPPGTQVWLKGVPAEHQVTFTALIAEETPRVC